MCFSMCQIIALKHLCFYFKHQGGFFIWVELPPSIDSQLLLQLAIEKHGMNFIIGSRLVKLH
jgi:DNA-binding transcriptional MocR family regulator